MKKIRIRLSKGVDKTFVEIEDTQGKGVSIGTWITEDPLYDLIEISSEEVERVGT